MGGPYGGAIPTAVTIDGAGNIVVVGSFLLTQNLGGSDLVCNNGSWDMFVAKYNAAGSHLWSNGFGGVEDDSCLAVGVDGSGNVYVAGCFRRTVDFGGGGLTSAGGHDIFVAKYSATGIHQWSHRFGDTQLDRCYGIAVDNAGDVVITGFFHGTVDFGGGNFVSVAPAGTDATGDVFLAKYDSAGIHQWSKAFGNVGVGIGAGEGSGVAFDASGNIIVTGEFTGTLDLGGGNLTSGPLASCFVAKYSSAGAHQWSFEAATTDGYTAGMSVAVDGSGNVIITGMLGGTADFGGGPLVSDQSQIALGPDMFLARYDASGNHQWSERFGGPGGEGGEKVAADAAGHIAVVGPFSGTTSFGGDTFSDGSGNGNGFVASYDQSGVHMWSRTDHSDYYGDTHAVAIDASGDVVIAGEFANNADLGGGPLSGRMYLAKYSSPELTAVGEAPRSFALSISAHPNPFNPETAVSYSLPVAEHVTIEVFDASGKRVRTLVNDDKPAGAHSVAWDGRNNQGVVVGSGVYFARLVSSTGVRSYKLTLLK